MLERRLSGVRIGRGNRPVSVMDYADDVTVFQTSAAEIPAIEDSIHLFEKASGARLNLRKSKILPIGRWHTSDTIFGISCHPHVKILVVHFRSTIHKSITVTWTQLTGHVRTQAKEFYSRKLCQAHRILYVHTYFPPRYGTWRRFSPLSGSASKN
jgi:hypothetical protein